MASAISDDKSSHVLALILLFYDRYKRSMLNEGDLNRILSKYSKPKSGGYEKLMNDLKKKYPMYSVPESASVAYLCKIFSAYAIPLAYKQIIFADLMKVADPAKLSAIAIPNSMSYNCKCDPLSEQFDASSVFSENRIITASGKGMPPLDNLAKAKFLVPGLMANPPPVHQSRESLELRLKPKNTYEKVVHLFGVMSEVALEKARISDKIPSPLSLLQKFVEEKARVRVILRRRKGVRGILNGYLKAFDKHFNLLMKDVDEEYTPLHSKKVFPKSQIAKSHRVVSKELVEDGVLKRHLPQLIVRGDNIIIVCRSRSMMSQRYRYEHPQSTASS